MTARTLRLSRPEGLSAESAAPRIGSSRLCVGGRALSYGGRINRQRACEQPPQRPRLALPICNAPTNTPTPCCIDQRDASAGRRAHTSAASGAQRERPPRPIRRPANGLHSTAKKGNVDGIDYASAHGTVRSASIPRSGGRIATANAEARWINTLPAWPALITVGVRQLVRHHTVTAEFYG